MDQDKSQHPRAIYRTNSRGRRVLYIQRTKAELEQIVRSRLGLLYEYDPFPKDHPLVEYLDQSNMIVIVDSLATACRVAVTRILHAEEVRPHLFLDGLKLMSIRLDQDEQMGSATFMDGFSTFKDLYLCFGFVEVQNKLNQETLTSLVERRFQYGQDCWLMIPSIDDLARRYSVSVESLRQKIPTISVIDDQRSPAKPTQNIGPAGSSPPSSTSFGKEMGHAIPQRRPMPGGSI